MGVGCKWIISVVGFAVTVNIRYPRPYKIPVGCTGYLCENVVDVPSVKLKDTKEDYVLRIRVYRMSRGVSHP